MSMAGWGWCRERLGSLTYLHEYGWMGLVQGEVGWVTDIPSWIWQDGAGTGRGGGN